MTSVFIRGTDDRLYERWLDTNAGVWAWTPHGGPTLAASPTATSIDGTARVFVRNTQGGIDENYRVNWTWLWGGHPGTNKVP